MVKYIHWSHKHMRTQVSIPNIMKTTQITSTHSKTLLYKSLVIQLQFKKTTESSIADDYDEFVVFILKKKRA